MKVTHVVWDWNGTLFDDLGCSVGVANQLLAEFGLPGIDGVEGYHAKFRFPIVDYYADLGFDVSAQGNFEAAAQRYIELYRAASTSCQLKAGATEALTALAAAGMRQVVISATRQDYLDAQVAPFALDRWLSGAYGLTDIYAHSKEALVRSWLAREGLSQHQVVMIGDSEHDFEIADAVGARCVLVTGGHQAREHLARLGAPVVDDLSSIPALILAPDASTGIGATVADPVAIRPASIGVPAWARRCSMRAPCWPAAPEHAALSWP